MCASSLSWLFLLQEIFSFMKSHLSNIALNFWGTGDLVKMSFPKPISCRYCLWILYSVSIFWVSHWGIWPFVVDFCPDKYRSHFILLLVEIHFFQHHLWEMLSFLYCVFLSSLSNNWQLYLHLLIFGYSTLCHWSTSLTLCQCHTVFITIPL